MHNQDSYKLKNHADVESFISLTYPYYREYLRSVVDPESGIHAWGIKADGQAIALLLLEKGEEWATVLSVYTKSLYRRSGFAQQLLEAAERWAGQNNCGGLSAVYTSGKPGGDALEALLKRRGWELPKTRMLILKFGLREMRPVFQARAASPHTGISIDLWKTVTRSELIALARAQTESPWIPERLQPWQYLEGYDEATSLVVRRDGKIHGWVLNHALDVTTLRHTCAYKHPDLGRYGTFRQALIESNHRAESMGYERAIIGVPVEFRSMFLFARKKMAQVSDFVGESREMKLKT